MKKVTLLSLVMPMLVTGCSSSPGTSSVRSYLDNYYGGFDCSKVVSITDVKKTNGVPGDGNYKVDFTYDLVLKKSINDALSQGDSCAVFLGEGMLLGNAKEGDHFHMTGSVDMVKSENGWIVKDR